MGLKYRIILNFKFIIDFFIKRQDKKFAFRTKLSKKLS